jgi:uncharacterized protein (DUF433 family)
MPTRRPPQARSRSARVRRSPPWRRGSARRGQHLVGDQTERENAFPAPLPPSRRRQAFLTFVHTVHTLDPMGTAYVSGRVPARYERLVTKQARAARTSKSDLVARYVIEKSLETEFPGISFRNSLSGREAYLTAHRVAVWEVVSVHDETRSIEKTASHFRWPRVLVKRALDYAKAFPDEIISARDGETDTASSAR